jgi:Flp pilus assembly protein protease CpaA
MSVLAMHPIAPRSTDLRHRTLSVGVALGIVAIVVASGLAGSTPLPILGWAAAFVFLAVEGDVRLQRIPNRLTFPALCLALVLATWSHGPHGLATALLGSATAFVLLLAPYAVGALGAGDVKAAMAIGALLGPAPTAVLLAFAFLVGGALAVGRVAASGELRDLAQRWCTGLVSSIATRRWVYVAAAPGSAAGRGIPFAVALGLAFAATLLREGLR